MAYQCKQIEIQAEERVKSFRIVMSRQLARWGSVEIKCTKGRQLWSRGRLMIQWPSNKQKARS